MARSDYLQKSKTYKGYHYSVLDPKALEYLHSRTLEMFKQIKDIFDRNDIRYMICGGTLLGALGGGNGHFIPWDDDFDVCVFEEDYDKVIELLTDSEKGLRDDAVLQCTKTDPNYYLGWMKVRDKRSHTYPDAPRFKENGVWIDLYKIVKRRALDVPVLIAEEAIEYLSRRLNAGGLTHEEYDARIREGQLVEKLNEAREKRDELLRETSDNSEHTRSKYIIWSASKVVLEEDWVEPLKNVSFEGMSVTTFGKAEEYLIQHYGDDYTELPPDEMRRVGLTSIEW